ncbi:hypothetical protein F53441_13856 [Fusarium austroafricanum]|uniref:Uncharacterized protein n=1 Tax=Fusarium austroafricanum TaxID=2364996 RepID=A0A8H4JKG4_9HYPO|nr:hypothetical protein F53441_13856 [Fusarium austroafricanum]
MQFYSLITMALALGATNASPIDNDVEIESRSCTAGIDLLKLKIKPGKFFTGAGKPGKCYELPENVKTFDLFSDDTKSLVKCFDCKVWTGPHCTGSFVEIQGVENFSTKSHKKTTYKSWKCGP